MADNDTKKSLSLKDRGQNNKSSKIVPGSKNVTIQVRRKKIINAQPSSDKKASQTSSRFDKTKAKTETPQKNTKRNANATPLKVSEAVGQKKKNKFSKDEKIEQFENRELHLKSKTKKVLIL